MQKAGASDQTIVDAFVKESGLSALGVSADARIQSARLGHAVRRVFSFGLGDRRIWFKKISRPRHGRCQRRTPVIDRRYQERMDKELEDFE